MEKNFEILLGKLEKIERISMLASKNVLNIDEVCMMTGLSQSRVHQLCSEKRIPYYKQGRTYFKRDEVEKWLTANRVPTMQETESKAELYCRTH